MDCAGKSRARGSRRHFHLGSQTARGRGTIPTISEAATFPSRSGVAAPHLRGSATALQIADARATFFDGSRVQGMQTLGGHLFRTSYFFVFKNTSLH